MKNNSSMNKNTIRVKIVIQIMCEWIHTINSNKIKARVQIQFKYKWKCF